MEAGRPLRQDQVAEQVTRRTLNKVTVYRTLESLVAVGLVHRAFTQTGRGILSWPIIARRSSVIHISRAQTAA